MPVALNPLDYNNLLPQNLSQKILENRYLIPVQFYHIIIEISSSFGLNLIK